MHLAILQIDPTVKVEWSAYNISHLCFTENGTLTGMRPMQIIREIG